MQTKQTTNLTEEQLIQKVKQSAIYIQYINEPSEAVQSAAVNTYGCSILFIKNPSEKIKLEAVNNNGFAIIYIKNPSKEVQQAAVKQNPLAIRYITNPNLKDIFNQDEKDNTKCL
jgi:hypothetical protein